MDKNLIEKYKNEMLNLYRSVKTTPVQAELSPDSQADPQAPRQTPDLPSVEEPPEVSIPQPSQQPPPRPMPSVLPESPMADGEGQLIGIVTALNGIYPVSGAKVTVFTGNYYNDMQVIDTAFTDSSGKTKSFTLSTPAKALSEQAGASQKPYASYNMLVEADGYIDNIHLNIPVFSGVVSLQGSNMMLSETAGENMGPQIFDEGQEFTLN